VDKRKNLFVSALLAALLCAAVGSPALAQDKFPSKPIKILVPYAPGGATDIVSRILGEQMRVILGQPVVTENKPGAFGILAIEEMARAKPDGYTFAKKFKINYDKDVVPVARLVDIPAIVAVSTKDFPPKTMAEFIAYAKQNKGKVRYGTVGVGSYPHFDMEVLAKRAGIELISIPNKAGASGILKDMATGDIQAAFLNVASSAPMVKAGQIRAIAAVNAKRLPDYPDLPTMEELGFKGVGTLAWQGLFAPGGTPKEVLEAISKAVLQAMEAPVVREAFTKQGFNIVPTKSADEAKTWLAGEIAAWRKTTQDVKIDLSE
jgi:tripartite-type tricarboxylate transporter receptor subunit TctC